MKCLLAAVLASVSTINVIGSVEYSANLPDSKVLQVVFQQNEPQNQDDNRFKIVVGDLKPARVIESFHLYSWTYTVTINGRTFDLDGMKHYKDSEQVVAALMPRDKTAVEYMRKTHKLPAFSVATAGQYLDAFGQDMANEKPKPAGLNLEPFFMVLFRSKCALG